VWAGDIQRVIDALELILRNRRRKFPSHTPRDAYLSNSASGWYAQYRCGADATSPVESTQSRSSRSGEPKVWRDVSLEPLLQLKTDDR
jgi:hypothetical protein